MKPVNAGLINVLSVFLMSSATFARKQKKMLFKLLLINESHKMKKSIPPIVAIFLYTTAFAADPISIKSKVSSVTVYNNAAQIEREAELSLKKGINEITLTNIPSNLIESSIQVKGVSATKVFILDVKTEDYYDNESQEKRKKRVQKSLDSLQVLKRQIEDELSVLTTKKLFLDGLKMELPKSSEKSGEKISPKEWSDLLGFLETNVRQVLESIRSQTNRKEKIEGEISVLNANSGGSFSGVQKQFKQIQVTLNAEESTVFKIKLTYLAYGVNWHPVYDARVNSLTKKMNLVSYGIVRQNTGEDWENISVSLSTAQPAVSTKIPDLAPDILGRNTINVRGGRSEAARSFVDRGTKKINIRYISNNSSKNGYGNLNGQLLDSKTYEPLPFANVVINNTNLGAVTDENGNFNISNINPGTYTVNVSYIGYGKVSVEKVQVVAGKSAILDVYLESMDMETESIVVTAERPMMDQESENETAVTVNEFITVSYQIKSQQNIPSDNFDHKFQIASTEYDMFFDYYSVPKLAEKTFLIGKFINVGNSPITEGNVNIFVDQNYVTNSNLAYVAPRDTVQLSLGVEDLIQVSRKLVKSYSETKGFISKKSKVSYEFEITLKNFRQTEETITIKDQAPVSWSENVKVVVLNPDPNEKLADDNNIISWKITLKPGETKKLNLAYEVMQ